MSGTETPDSTQARRALLMVWAFGCPASAASAAPRVLFAPSAWGEAKDQELPPHVPCLFRVQVRVQVRVPVRVKCFFCSRGRGLGVDHGTYVSKLPTPRPRQAISSFDLVTWVQNPKHGLVHVGRGANISKFQQLSGFGFQPQKTQQAKMYNVSQQQPCFRACCPTLTTKIVFLFWKAALLNMQLPSEGSYLEGLAWGRGNKGVKMDT